MDHSYIDQSNVVDRYLMGKLAAEESARFEEHFVDCPQCVDRLKTTKNFLQDLRTVSVQQALQEGGQMSERLRSFFSRIFSHHYLALAASCLLILTGAGAILLFNHMQRLQSDVNRAKNESAQWQRSYEEERQAAALSDEKREETERELTGQLNDLKEKLRTDQERRAETAEGSDAWIQPGLNMPLFALNSVRRGEGNSSETVNEVTLPRSAPGFVFSVGLEGEAKYKDYCITIRDDRDRQLMNRCGFEANRFNSLSIVFNSKFFRPGKYLLIVSVPAKGGGSSVIGNYPFQVTKK